MAAVSNTTCTCAAVVISSVMPFLSAASKAVLAAVAAIFAVAVVYHAVPNLFHDASSTAIASALVFSSSSFNPAIVAAMLSVLPLITVPTSSAFTHALVNHAIMLALFESAVISVHAKVESIVVGGVFSSPNHI